jgi:hypothetical protein
MRETLASIQEAQQKMTMDLAQLHQRLARSDALEASTPSPSQSPVPDPGHSTPRVVKVDEAVAPIAVPPSESEHRENTLWKWNSVKPPRRKRKGKVITGKEEAVAEEEGAFRGAPAVGSLFVYNSRKDSTVDAVCRWLKSRNVDVVNIRVASHPDAALKSFKVTVSRDNANRLLQPDFSWPHNVKVRRFTPGPLRTH